MAKQSAGANPIPDCDQSRTPVAHHVTGSETDAFMTCISNRLAKFVIAFIAMTIVCTFVWQMSVYGKLYYCSDPVLDFLDPGNWVHMVNDQPVQVVSHVVVSSSWSVPDSIKEGWSTTRLWHLWWSFVAVSLIVSLVLSQVYWFPNARRRHPAMAGFLR